MSGGDRLADYLGHMADAAAQALNYVQAMDKTGFLADRRTQQAVILNLMILGEAATRVLAEHAEFAAAHPQIPWKNIKGMRNRIAHGYFELDLDVVWETVTSALPRLADELPAIRTRVPIPAPTRPAAA